MYFGLCRSDLAEELRCLEEDRSLIDVLSSGDNQSKIIMNILIVRDSNTCGFHYYQYGDSKRKSWLPLSVPIAQPPTPTS